MYIYTYLPNPPAPTADYKYIDLDPDPRNESCHSSYRNVSGRDATAK
jgi:hypothetical protein